MLTPRWDCFPCCHLKYTKLQIVVVVIKTRITLKSSICFYMEKCNNIALHKMFPLGVVILGLSYLVLNKHTEFESCILLPMGSFARNAEPQTFKLQSDPFRLSSEHREAQDEFLLLQKSTDCNWKSVARTGNNVLEIKKSMPTTAFSHHLKLSVFGVGTTTKTTNDQDVMSLLNS